MIAAPTPTLLPNHGPQEKFGRFSGFYSVVMMKMTAMRPREVRQ